MMHIRRRLRLVSALAIVALLGWPLYSYAVIATTLTKLELNIGLTWLFEGAQDGGNATVNPKHVFTGTLTDGDAINAAEICWFDTDTVGSTATDIIDLAGVLVDAYGNTLTFTKVKVVYFKNHSTTVGDILRLESDGTAGFIGMFKAEGDGVQVLPGGAFLWYGPSAAGAGVTATTLDLLNVTNEAATTVTYSLAICGTD